MLFLPDQDKSTQPADTLGTKATRLRPSDKCAGETEGRAEEGRTRTEAKADSVPHKCWDEDLKSNSFGSRPSIMKM